MNIQFIDCTNMFSQIPSEKVVAKKEQRREFSWSPSWSPEAKTINSPYGISLTPPIFTISEIVHKILSPLSKADLHNFEAVCKGHRYVTFPLWNSFRAQKNLTYNWRVCESLEFKEKSNYILSNFFLLYTPMLNREKPLKEIGEQMAILCRLFPIFNTFIDAISSAKQNHKSLEKFYGKLKEEPILHAAVSIYRCLNEKMRSNNNAITFMPDETIQIASQAMSAGATCLSKFAIILCDKKTYRTVQARYTPFLLALAKQAQKRGDPSGQKQLAEYGSRHKVYHLDSLSGTLAKQEFFEPTADEILKENEQFRNLMSRILNPHRDLNTSDDGFCDPPEARMIQLVNLEKYEQANDILEALTKRGCQLSWQSSYVSVIRIKTHFKKFDEVAVLYDTAKKILGKKPELLRDLSFLIDCAKFQLEHSKKEALQTAHGYLMQYWEGQTWHNELIFNYLNCKLVIKTEEDFQVELFQKLLELIIIIKEKLHFEDDAMWFKNVLAAIMLDRNDSQASLELHELFVSQGFYYHSSNESLPEVLQEKIKKEKIKKMAYLLDNTGEYWRIKQ